MNGDGDGVTTLGMASDRELRRSNSIRQEEDEEESDMISEEDDRSSFPRRLMHKTANWWRGSITWIGDHSNFYRIHLIVFILVPLIASVIVYYADGQRRNTYVNILTVSVSAMTVTGLNPVLMETLTHFQQAVLFFLSCIGSTSGVSLITIIIRRYYFGKRFAQMVRTDPRARKRVRDVEEAEEKRNRYHHMLHPFAYKPGSQDMATNEKLSPSPRHSQGNTPVESRSGTPQPRPNKKRKRDKLHVGMIRRIEEPVRVNQMNVGGFLSERASPNVRQSLELQPISSNILVGDGSAASPEGDAVLDHTATRTDSPRQMSMVGVEGPEADPLPRTRRVSIEPGSARRRSVQLPAAITVTEPTPGTSLPRSLDLGETALDDTSSDDEEAADANANAGNRLMFQTHSRRSSDPAALPSRPRDTGREFKRVRTLDPPKQPRTPIHGNNFPRTQTIEIREPSHPDRELRKTYSTAIPHIGAMQGEGMRRRAPTGLSGFSGGAGIDRVTSRRVSVYNGEPLQRTATRSGAMSQGFGGFPNPVKAVATAVSNRIMQSTATNDLQRTTTLQSVHSNNGMSDFSAGPTRAVSYISFDAVVGRNSRFYSLTSSQRDELGGVEYRALSALLKIVAGYYVLVQLIPMIILAPIFQSGHYAWLFQEQDQGTVTNAGGWYVTFNVVSAYSNSGLSLLDESMTPFQQSYGYIVVMGFLILAGNTAYPIFLRLIIWTLSKLVPARSKLRETLQFLLDHPRRCYIYLFPSHQTWVLVVMLVVLNCTDWICFLVLDIGNPIIYGLPKAARAFDGLLQAFAVRAAGFSIVALSETAPALQVLYVVMMYIAVYPIALSVRSTNVYEERAMGVFNDADDGDSEAEDEFERNHKAGGYFAHHARKQLAFDIWWIALALWAICIVERSNIDDPATDSYFNVFTILFELISAYGTVGLSLGSPNANYSLCGDFRVLSKVILCAVMIRGRHRGLPVAIDRSILLPSDLEAMHPRPVDEEEEAPISSNGTNGYHTASDDDGTLIPASTIRKKSSRVSSNGGMNGSTRIRRTSSNLSGRSTKQLPNRGHARGDSVNSQSIQFADNTNSARERTPKPGLNSYLSTIYSERPTPAATPSLETDGRLEEVSRNSSEEVSGKSALSSA